MRHGPRVRAVGLGLVLALGVLGCRAGVSISGEETAVAVPAEQAESAVPGEPTVPAPVTPAEDADAQPDLEQPEAEAAVPVQAQERTPEAVSAAFEEYRESLLTLDGERASRIVTQSTFEYYDRILTAGLNAEAQELIDGMPISDALGMLSMRAQIGDELRDVPDGIRLFQIGVERDLVGDNVGSQQLDSFEVNGDEAFGLLQGQAIIRFQYVEGGWLFDLPFTTDFLDANEAEFVTGLTGGTGGRAELYDVIAQTYGTTWEALSQPIG